MREDIPWNRVWEPQQLTPYAYRQNQWVGYDDVMSIKIKAEYVIAQRLGGAVIYSLDTDDFTGVCDLEYPLVRAVKEAFKAAPPTTIYSTTMSNTASGLIKNILDDVQKLLDNLLKGK